MTDKPGNNGNDQASNDENVNVNIGEQDSKGRRITPWSWIPTVYFAQGLQYAIVIQLFVVIFFTMGVPLGKALLWIGLLQLPWTIKPLWGPLVDKYWTKRRWTYVMQMLVGACFVGTAFCLLLPGMSFFNPVLFFLFGLAFAAATHDIACDGYYMMGLNEKQQAFFVGIRSTVFRLALIFANGALPFIAGIVLQMSGMPPASISVTVEEAAAVAAEEAPAGSQAGTIAASGMFLDEPWPTSAEPAVVMMPAELSAAAGKKQYVTIRLTQPPEDEEQIVTLEFDKGRGISIPKDYERIVFTQGNWEAGIDIPVTVDPKAGSGATDKLTAKSGNIALSWWVVTMICGGFFLIVFVYHKFILPYPHADVPAAGAKPFFLWPVFCLALTIGVPWGIGYGIYKGLGTFEDEMRTATVGALPYNSVIEVKNYVDGKDAVEADALMNLAEQIKQTGIAKDAAELQKIYELRQYLQNAGILDNEDNQAEAYQYIERIQTEPELYGGPRIREFLVDLRGVNDGELPQTREEFDEIIALTKAPVLEEMPENADRLFSALSAIAEVKVDMAEVGEEDTEAAAAIDRLPENREQLDNIVAMGMEAPTSLEAKGFDFFFTAGRLLILILLGVIVFYTPLWAIARGFFYTLSNASQIGFAEVFGTFFSKTGMGVTLGFLLTFRLGEAQLAQVKNPFLLAARDTQGLGMSLQEFAFTNGVVYLAALTVGGILGGFLISGYGLKKVIWPMVAFMHLPNALYIWLAAAQPESLLPVNVVVGFESFGYGFGFTAYLMVMILAAQGPYKTAHYALCTGAMALGYMIPGMWAGYLQELTGYTQFFTIVMIFVIPGILFIPFLKIDPNFGKKAHTEKTMEIEE